MSRLLRILLLAATLSCAQAIQAQPAADTVLYNGKIVTVDDFFAVEEAIAIRGERIVAIGTDAEMRDLAGSNTTLIDLRGRTVIPGLIDNHNHIIRATEYWPNEARLDGVTSRLEALTLLEEKAAALPAGEWLMSLGGWTEAQFVDDQSDFTLAELDEIAPDRPAFVQSTYDHVFANSRWFDAMGIPLVASRSQQGAQSDLAAYVVRDETGRATGRLNGGIGMVALAIERFPEVAAERQLAAIRAALTHLNSIGLTSVYDPGGVGISAESYTRLRGLADGDGLTVRMFHTLGGGTPSTPAEARDVVAQIEMTRPFQGDHVMDLIAIGEIYYAPFHWDGLFEPRRPNAEDLAAARSILTAAAAGGWSVQTHAAHPETIDLLLDVMTDINAEYPLRQLRWSITHADRVGPTQLERIRHLGMNLQLRSISVLAQPRRYRLLEDLGEAALHVPPLRLVQASGVPWGLGTDGTKATQINPFITLWWAVTGHALNGDTVLVETLTREQALIAHTRSNAYLLFQEANIGALEPGLLADMLVLDRDYLTVPADEIRDIRPVATIVGGQVVWGDL